MAFVHGHPELTSRPVAEFSADFHLGRQGNDGDPDLFPDARLEGFMDVSWVTCGERTEDNEDLSRGVSGEMAVWLV